MRNSLVRDLADCSEFRQTLLARPPKVVHATAALLVALLGAAMLWLALTDADLVVRAGGRVRPVGTPARVVATGDGDSLSASPGGVVAEVCFHEGDMVRRGDVLLRLETGRLAIEREKRQRTIRAGEEELAAGTELLQAMTRQLDADRAVSEAELAQAREEVRLAKAQHGLALRQAEDDLKVAEREVTRQQEVVARGAGSAGELDRVRAQADEARTKLAKARLPVDESKVNVLSRRLAQLPENQAVKRHELQMRLALKRGEVEAVRKDLEDLELRHSQATVLAPRDGVVTSGEIKAGDVLERGKAVVEIAEQRGFLFEAIVPSAEVGRLRVGLPVRVKLDAYDYQKYGTAAGTVVFIAPDSNVPEGSRTATYLVRIELDGDSVGRGEWQGRVKLGMVGQAEIVTDRESLLSLLVRKIRQTISLG